jgi:FkbM family methyltransferase
MNKFLCRICSAFILNKQQRKDFRKKYIKTKQPMIETLLDISNNKGYVYLSDVDWKVYEQDANILKQNLSSQELDKLNHILNRIERATVYNYYKMTDIYTYEELKKFYKMKSIKNSIKKVSDGDRKYYQLYNYKLPVCSYEPSIFYDKYGLDKLKTISKIKQNNKAIFDIGAYVGDSALILKEAFPDNTLYAFECVNTFYNYILQTIELNNLENVIPVNLALGNTEGEREIYFNNHSNISKMMTLDKYVSENNIEVGLIKSDIEGGEWDLLQGAVETIKKQKPVLLISIYHCYRDFFKIKPFIESLNCGYKFSFCDSCYGNQPIHEITLNCEVE